MQRKQAKAVIDLVISQLHDERLKQDLSHEKLALMCGLHRSTISLIEARKREPTLLNLLRIADALGYKLGRLIDKATELNRSKL